MVEKKVTILNKAGLHARPSSMIVKAATRFDSDVFIGVENHMVNAKSIMGVMTLGAGIGEELLLTADGTDEQEAVDSIAKLFENKFADE